MTGPEIIARLRRALDFAEAHWSSPLVGTPESRAQARGAIRMHRAAVDRLERAWGRVARGELAAASWAAAAEDIRRAVESHAREAAELRAPIMAIASAVTPAAVVDALDRMTREARPTWQGALRWGALILGGIVAWRLLSR